VSGPARDVWSALTDVWQRQTAWAAPEFPGGILGRKVRAHRRLMRWVLAVEVLITVASLAASVALLRWHGGITGTAAAVYTWVLLAVVWSFAVSNRRGTWRPVAETTRAYLDLSALRCRRQLRTVWLVIVLAAVQFGCVTLWLAARVLQTPSLLTPSRALVGWIVGGLMTAIYVGWAVWFRRRTLRERAWLAVVRAEISEAET